MLLRFFRVISIVGIAALFACAGTDRRTLNPAPTSGSGAVARYPEIPFPDQESPREAAPARSPQPILLDDIALLVREATDRYFLGEEAYRAGELDRARHHFDEAVLLFLNTDLQVETEPRLRDAFNRILVDIQSLETEALAGMDEGGPGFVDAPVEDLTDITSFLTPEELALEMKKVRAPAEEDQYSLPVVVNERVLTMMDAYQSRFRDAFIGGYRRMGRYEPMIRRTLREVGVPEDLIHLAFVESTYKTNAYSRARAKGMWQFMASTGRRYGLRRTSWVDERSDPEKSTRAAATYLKELYELFGDWHLAMAAYNAGEGKVIRAIERTGSRDFWALARTRYLRRETKNFVPSILAISIMARDPERYGFKGLKKDAPLEFDRVAVEDAAELSLVARLAGTSTKRLRELNPELRRNVTPPGARGYRLRVPRGTGTKFSSAYAALSSSEKIAKVDTLYRVRQGDTLSGIARRHGTSVSALTRANGISTRTILRIGMKLRVPGGGLGRASWHRDAYDGPMADADGRYLVRRGDTLWSIAVRHGTTISALTALNGISKRTVLHPGQILRVRSGSGTRSRTASLAPSASGGSYRVNRGDTLSRIAKRHGTTPEAIASLNGISTRSTIYPGQRLRIPGGGSPRASSSGKSDGRLVRYTVRRGDSLYEIAQRHGTTVERLKEWNGRRGNRIYPGEVLTIYVR